MAFCSVCGTPIAEGSICPVCSAKGSPSAVAVTGGVLADNIAGLLAYVTIIPAIVFLVTPPYNKSRFVRFHSFQSIFFCVAMIVIWIGFAMLGVVPGLIFIMIPIHLLIWLGSFILWIVLLIKANQGQMWKLPVIGDLAEKQANA
jgi:uncharacterized membrane protein